MGWNSWDSFGTTVSEADFRENAQFLADHLKQFGWNYAVVDMEWFVTNPKPEGNSKTSEYAFDDLRAVCSGAEAIPFFGGRSRI